VDGRRHLLAVDHDEARPCPAAPGPILLASDTGTSIARNPGRHDLACLGDHGRNDRAELVNQPEELADVSWDRKRPS